MKKCLQIVVPMMLLLLFASCTVQSQASSQNEGASAGDAQPGGEALSHYALGNSVENFTNRWNSAVLKDGWVYYTTNQSFFKTRDDFKTQHKLGNHAAYSINVAGDWIYYLKPEYYAAFPSVSQIESVYIWKMRTDGSQDQPLGIDESVDSLSVINDYVYYLTFDERLLYRVHIDGGEKEQLTTAAAYLPLVHGEEIYLMLRSGGIFQMDADGAILRKLSDAKAYGGAVEGAWLYYVGKDHSDYIMRVRLDGTEEEPWADVQADDFTIYDGYMYHIGSARIALNVGRYPLMRTNMETAETELMWRNWTTTFSIAGEYLYLWDEQYETTNPPQLRIHLKSLEEEWIP